MIRRSIALITVFLAAGLVHLWADDATAAQQFLDSAHVPADLFHSARTPFVLEVDFTVQLDVPTRGLFLLKWKSENKWWSKVVLGGFQQITIQNGETRNTARNLAFTPVAVHALFHLLHFMESPTPFSAKKMKNRSQDGVSLVCFQAEPTINQLKDKHELCINANTRDQLSDDWQEGLDEKKRIQYADYFNFGNTRFPRKLQLLYNGKSVIAANVIRLEATEFDDTLFNPPKGSIERRICAEMKPPTPINAQNQFIDTGGRHNGDTAVSVTVLKDGSIGDIQLIGNGGPAIDDSALAAIKKWKFTPAMCGSEPVVADTQIYVDFRSY